MKISHPLDPEKMIEVSPEEHPLNEQAMEILEAMGWEQETQLPILGLIIWAHGGTYPEDEHQRETLEQLMGMSNAQAMRMIEGQNQENGLPELTPEELEHLQIGTERQQERVEAGLRRNLKNLFAEVVYEKKLIDEWIQDLIQELNNFYQELDNLESLKKIDTLITKKYAGQKECDKALKACNLSYLDPKVDRLRILLERLRYVQKDTN